MKVYELSSTQILKGASMVALYLLLWVIPGVLKKIDGTPYAEEFIEKVENKTHNYGEDSTQFELLKEFKKKL